MRSQLYLGIAAVLTAISAGSTQVATAWEPTHFQVLTMSGGTPWFSGMQPGRLAALSARQSLRDEVCAATVNGRISSAERSNILADARRILKPREYEAFKQSIDKLSPPTSSHRQSFSEVRTTKVVQQGATAIAVRTPEVSTSDGATSTAGTAMASDRSQIHPVASADQTR